MRPSRFLAFGEEVRSSLSAVQTACAEIVLTALKNRATFSLKNGPPSTQHFFATNALHPTVALIRN